MESTFSQINDLALKLKSFQPIKPEYQKKLDKKFRLEFNYNSNHIEGNTLTYSHTELLLIFDKISGDYNAREIEEMKAHDVALAMIRELAEDSERDLTESFIRQLNEIILVRPFWKEAITESGQPTRRLIEPGSYKKFPNSVLLSNGEMFDYASPEETPVLMTDLIDFYRRNLDKHPVWQAAMLHYKFVRIHPFDDGNGRVARLLMNYVVLKNQLPPIIIKSIEKKAYLTALNKADAGDIDAFVKYIADQALWSLEISIKAAEGKSLDEPSDLEKEISLLKRDLSFENILHTEKNPERVAEAFIENIIPLFTSIEERCADLMPLFFDYDRVMTYEINEPQGAKRALGSKNSVWDVLVKNWLLGRIKTGSEKIMSFRYEYTLKGFKKNINAYNCYVVVNIFFNSYNYTMSGAGASQGGVIVPYGKKLTGEELAAFYRPLIMDVVDNIKRYSELS